MNNLQRHSIIKWLEFAYLLLHIVKNPPIFHHHNNIDREGVVFGTFFAIISDFKIINFMYSVDNFTICSSDYRWTGFGKLNS
ncbi:hypothetical protein DERF_010119 [Dermatophagoides farinae]|uniref:Uncharacterized protein n=1 Tax=Dermatophagoides farinae TaxID=6954 RepID=A0A922L4P7_DERFA|nr:hypothetical protein DERF_010119 [Dermatophagoides farinae]